MNATRTALTAALAAVVLIGTGAAAGAVAAAPGPDDASGDREAGPPSDLPERVPDFVGGILDSVTEFLSGNVSDLGETVSDVAGGDAPGGNATDGDGGDDA